MGKNLLLFLYICFSCCACSSSRLVRKADKQFNKGAYADAALLYRKAYQKTSHSKRPERGYIAFQIAETNRYTGRNLRSLSAYKNAIRYNYPDTTLHLRLGQSYQKNRQYEEAIKEYNMYLSAHPGCQLAINILQGCRMAQKREANPTRHQIKKIPVINSGRSDSSPVFYQQDTTNLYWTSTRPLKKKEKNSSTSGQPYSRVWSSKMNQFGIWQKPQLTEEVSVDKKDISSHYFSKNGQFIYYTLSSVSSQKNQQHQIYRAEKLYGKWREGTPVFKNPSAITAHPALSPKEDYLYFVSDISGGYGGKDIYRCQIYPDSLGKWENLGPAINTAGDELHPYIKDDKTIYFSSDGHPGMGGLDIFQATLSDAETWEIQHMGYPLNSHADDFSIRFKGNTEKGIFCSSRNNNLGYIDLFEFEIPSFQIYMEGYIMDTEGNRLSEGEIHIANTQGVYEKAKLSVTGFYRILLEAGTEYTIMASSPGYLNQPVTFRTTTEEINETYFIDFHLTPYTIPSLPYTVLHDFNSSDIQTGSKPILENIIKTLKEYPSTHIEIISHADRHGKKSYNQKLSEQRASLIQNQLIQAGIEKERITIKGCGNKYPIEATEAELSIDEMTEKKIILTPTFIEKLNKVTQEKADQLNRRTEFKITGYSSEVF